MDLENYEADLADYSLQDSPFYEANTPMIFDLSVSAVNSILGAHSGKGKSVMMLKSTINESASVTDGPHYNNNNNNNALNGSAYNGNSSNGIGTINHMNNNSSGNINEAVSNADNLMSASRGTANKKKRKCVTFLPNYVQVFIQFPLF